MLPQNLMNQHSKSSDPHMKFMFLTVLYNYYTICMMHDNYLEKWMYVCMTQCMVMKTLHNTMLGEESVG